MNLVPSTLRKFPFVYWTAMSFELMERGAYYLMMPILVIHAQYNVGVPLALASVITMFMYPIQYGVPIVSGALAEKLGYRNQMIFAFSVLAAAYFILSFANSPIFMIASVMLIGFGIGSYKPLVSSTIAKSTSSKDRNLAYSIYYWIVNLAAAVFPTIWVALELAGVVDETVYSYVFRIGGFFILINILTALFIFKEVPRSGEVRTVRDVGRNITVAFKDYKFVTMVLLIGGFWALYSSMLNALPLSLFNFKLVPVWFSPMLLGIFNPATIIGLGFFISKRVERMESLKVVMAGIILYVIGLALIGFTLNWIAVIFGIIIASIGEFMVAPGYYSFISKLAPKEKVSAYLGCNFLSSMVGLAGGTLAFGQLYTWVGAGMGRPKLFYGILIALGLLLLIGFMLYYKAWGQDIIQRARSIAIAESEDGHPPPAVIEPRIMRIFEKRATVVVPALIIPVVIFITYSMGTNIYYPPENEIEDVDISFDENVATISANGYSSEGSGEPIPFNITDRLSYFNVTLTWQDEAVSGVFRENQADNFRIVLTAPSGRIYDGCSEESFTGRAEITFKATLESSEERGDWTLDVICVEAGDIKSRGPFGLWTFEPDDGNEWSISGTYTTLVERS